MPIVPEVPAIREEVRRLKDSGVDIVIALGNAGHRRNAEIARSVPDLDAVVAAPVEARSVVADSFPQAVSEGADVSWSRVKHGEVTWLHNLKWFILIEISHSRLG